MPLKYCQYYSLLSIIELLLFSPSPIFTMKLITLEKSIQGNDISIGKYKEKQHYFTFYINAYLLIQNSTIANIKRFKTTSIGDPLETIIGIVIVILRP